MQAWQQHCCLRGTCCLYQRTPCPAIFSVSLNKCSHDLYSITSSSKSVYLYQNNTFAHFHENRSTFSVCPEILAAIKTLSNYTHCHSFHCFSEACSFS